MSDDKKILRALPQNTISLIGSCQVITNVFSVVKELVENSLDAEASSVDVKLDDYGLEKIEVVDNGSGVKAGDVPFMGRRHFTSKITCSEDLNSLDTYGFRGEALGSLCAVSNVTITTKTVKDQFSFIYTLGPHGDVLDKKPSHSGKGTVVCSKNLFHNVPVRKQYYSGSQRKKEDLKRIEYLLMVYAMVKPSLRLTLKHGKELLFQKTAFKDFKTSLHSVLGRQVSNQMLYKEKDVEEVKLKISAFIPKPGSDVREMSFVSADKSFVAVNNRPVLIPEINKILRSYYSTCHDLDTHRFPVCFVSLQVATDQIDVNVDPNKTKIFFQHKTEILNALEEILVEVYGPLENVPSWHYTEANGHQDTKETEKELAKNNNKNASRHSITYSSRPGDSQHSDGGKHVEEKQNQQENLELKESNKCHQEGQNQQTDSMPKESDTNICIEGSHNQLTKFKESNVDNVINLPPISEIFHTKTHKTTSESTVSKSIVTEDNAISSGSSASGVEDIETIRVEYDNESIRTEKDMEKDSSALRNDQSSLSHAYRSEDYPTVLQQTTEKPPLFDVMGLDQTGAVGHIEKGESIACAENIRTLDVVVIGDNVGDRDKVLDDQIEDREKTIDDQVDEGEKALSDIDPKSWSRGTVTVGTSVLQPVKLLPPSDETVSRKRPLCSQARNMLSQPKRKAPKLMMPLNQTTLLDMMGAHQIKRADSSFTHFLKEKLPSLSQEHPEENESSITERVRQVWTALSDTEKVEYKEKCWYDTKRYEKEKLSNKLGQSTNESKTETTKKKVAEKKRRVLKKRMYPKERSISIPINELRTSNRDTAPSANTTNTELEVIGAAYKSDDVWFFSLHHKLYLANVWRLAEVCLYKKLKAEHRLPVQPCDPVPLDSRVVSQQGLAMLEHLARENEGHGTFFHMTDERLLHNGFDVKCHNDSNGNFTCELVGLCNVVPAYDLKDLNKILDVLKSRPEVSLSETRTLKAAYYLQGEAVRMTRQSGVRMSAQDVHSLLESAVTKLEQSCLHHQPIFKEIMDLTPCDGDSDKT